MIQAEKSLRGFENYYSLQRFDEGYWAEYLKFCVTELRLSEYDLDVDTTKFILAAAHQKENLIHRY